MEYNTERGHLIIPEYGRNIQKMIQHTLTIEDREERNRAAKTITTIMGQLNSQTKNMEEFQQKIWNHLFIISDYKLDVDSPYPKPEKDKIEEKPEKLGYNGNKIKYRHYGKSVEGLIEKASAMEEGEEKEAFTISIANLMKKSYLMWNRDSVNDETIVKQLTEMSEGKLKLKEDFEFISTGTIISKNKPRKKSNGGSNNSGGRHKSNNNNNRSRGRKY